MAAIPILSPRRRVAPVLAVLVWALSASVVRGQGFPGGSEGLNFGRFTLHPSVTFEYTDDSNVFYTSRELPGDQLVASGVTVVRPRILMDMPVGASRVRWVYSPVYRGYSSDRFDQRRRFSHYFDFEAVHTGPVISVRAADHFVLGTVELTEVDRGGEAVFGTTPFKSQSAEAEVTLNLGARNGLAVLPQYTAVSFDDSGAASFFGYRRQQIQVRLQHAVSLPSQLYVFYLVDATQQDRNQVFFGNVSYDARSAGLGLRRTINREVVTFVNAGYKTINFTGGARSHFAGPVFDANAVIQLGDGALLNLTGAHQAYQSFYVNNNYYVDTEVRLQWSHQVGHSLFWTAAIGLSTNHYADPLDISVTPDTPADQDCNPTVPDPANPGRTLCGGDGRIDAFESLQPSVGLRRRDRISHMEFGGGWQISPVLRVFIGYNSDRRRSNVEQVISGQLVDPFDYRVNRMVFRLEAGWM